MDLRARRAVPRRSRAATENRPISKVAQVPGSGTAGTPLVETKAVPVGEVADELCAERLDSEPESGPRRP